MKFVPAVLSLVIVSFVPLAAMLVDCNDIKIGRLKSLDCAKKVAKQATKDAEKDGKKSGSISQIRVTREYNKVLDAILALQQANYAQDLYAVSAAQKNSGYVTKIYTRQQLEAIVNTPAQGAVFVAHYGRDIVGYLIAVVPTFWPTLFDGNDQKKAEKQIHTLNEAKISDGAGVKRPLGQHNYCLVSQVCVAAGYRHQDYPGLKIFTRLQEAFKCTYAMQYNYAVALVHHENGPAVTAHQRRKYWIHDALGTDTYLMYLFVCDLKSSEQNEAKAVV